MCAGHVHVFRTKAKEAVPVQQFPVLVNDNATCSVSWDLVERCLVQTATKTIGKFALSSKNSRGNGIKHLHTINVGSLINYGIIFR